MWTHSLVLRMHLRSGTVTVTPVIMWPHPSDVRAKRHLEPDRLMEDLQTIFSRHKKPDLTTRRLLFLEICETLLRNKHLSAHTNKLVQIAVNRLDDEGSHITTFDAKVYSDRLRALVF